VGVIGIQLRKIMAIGKEPPSENKQQTYIKNCYFAALNAVQLINFALLSAFWDAQQNHTYALHEAESKIITAFFEDRIQWDLTNHLLLLQQLLALFERHNLQLPLEELQQLDTKRLLKIGGRIQKLYGLLERSQHALLTCFEIEGQLTQFLKQLILLSNYKMLSVKNIAYDERRAAPPQYIHSYIELGIDQKFNENTEKINILGMPVVTDAVIIHHQHQNHEQNINLSPFVIDYNTQMLEKGAKICFFSSKHISDGSLNYCFLEDNSIENIVFSDMLQKYKIEELMRNRSNYIQFKFDLVHIQFEEAKQHILKNSAQGQEEDNIDLDDLFD
jgi:hypothetical protein